jgi:phosphatidylinositol-3-phosphatase
MKKIAAFAIALIGLQVAPTVAAADTPHVNHLFIVVLENEDAADTFGANPPAPYLAQTLRGQGAYLPNYYGIGHNSLDNYLAMISGQPPNPMTQADCPLFTEMTPGTVGSDGIALGLGCVYPRAVPTVANQLEDSGHTWRGYMQDMASGAGAGEATSCRHPAIGAQDKTQTARPGDQYATRHDPFVYFHSIIDFSTCGRNVVDLSQLPKDLASDSSTPEYSFITPDLCADGHDATCADGTSPGGFAGIEAFLKEWAPRIESSPAFQDRGALLITFDESANGAESCCGETNGPNTPNNGATTSGSGGGRVGAVLTSPCIAPGTEASAPYNHYSMLRWVEDNFGLAHLANAAPSGLQPFGSDVFNRPGCEQETALKVKPHKAKSGKKVNFKFQLTAALPTCLEGVTIGFAGRHVKTDNHGVAQIKARLRGRGKRIATAIPAFCDKSTASVLVHKKRVHKHKHG